jgi:hypothetical protein
MRENLEKKRINVEGESKVSSNLEDSASSHRLINKNSSEKHIRRINGSKSDEFFVE